MIKRQAIILRVAVMFGLSMLWLAACHDDRGAAETARGEHGDAKDEVAKGPHGGRVLSDGDFAVEVTIYERGVPPEFRVYAFEGKRPVGPAEVTLEMALHRFGGRVDRFRFQKRDDYLIGDRTVEEPHSFEVEVVAQHRNGAHRWTYESWEGRTEMSPAAITSSGISIDTVGPATIRTTITAYGRVGPNEDHLARMIPRYSGIVKEMRKRLGDRVAQGDILALVESNQSLQAYEIRSPISGTVIGKHVTSGELAREAEAIYTIADLGTVWADLNVHHRDFRHLKIGQAVSLEIAEDVARAEGTIIYLSPLGAENTQTLLARVEVQNPDGHWRPGLFATADILAAETTVPTAVKASALQTFRDWDVVFLNDGRVFQATPIELGRRDAEWVEVTDGLKPGDRYAAENSFIVKADVGKSGATHDH